MTKLCKICNAEIPAGRLKAIPNAQTCVQHSTESAWKVNVVNVGDVEKDDHYQEFEIIKDPSTYQKLQDYKNQQGNYSKK